MANNGIGVAGVAYSCRIVPVRVYTSSSTVNDITTAGWMANGISWAAQNNAADVLSMSFKIHVGQQSITNAINNAVAAGRNGKGCVVLVATGNTGDASIDFPASCPNAIAIGASTNTDLRASFSQYGPGLDVTAPGVDVYTTDLTGSAGYSTTDYTLFSGTSAATPNAAGVAALILSVNPNLTSTQVRQVLESTADKVGGYTYTAGAGENTNYTWNSEMGYGRVNACRAVQQAPLSIAGAAQFCSGTSSYSVTNSPANFRFTWSSSNTNVATIDAASGVATGVGNGLVTFTATTSSGCGTSVSKTVQVGSPSATNIVGMDPSTYFSAGQTVTLSVNESASGYSWDIYGGTIIGSSTDQSVTVQLDNCFSGQNANNDFDANVTLTGGCGTSPIYHEHTYATCNGGINPMLSIASNPASSTTEVFLSDKKDMTKRGSIKEIKVVDSWGTIKYAAKYEGGKTSVVLDISSLPNNLYTVSAFDGKSWINAKLVKN